MNTMKQMMTLLAVLGMVLALAPTAQAAITLDGMAPFTYNDNTPTAGDWQVTAYDSRKGALTIDGGSQLDMNGFFLGMGWGGDTTFTVTGDDGSGTASKLIADNGVIVGQNASAGTLNVEAGGWADVTGNLDMGVSGAGSISVTGANSKLIANNRIMIGSQVAGSALGQIVTIADSGLVQVASLLIGQNQGGPYAETGGYVHMGVGGVLAVEGDHMTNPFVTGGLFTRTAQDGAFGEIQYDPGTGFENMTGATEGVDYSLTYAASGADLINGEDVNGYTVLTMLVPPPAGTVIMFK